MKFKIRFADQIVGFFIVLSLASLAFVIVMLGRSQRWFAKDAMFTTLLPSAGGLSKNMAVQYRGFTIGNVKDFYLTDQDEVEVVFSIYEAYKDRAREGSLVELMISPIGLGNQFLFHAGKGGTLSEDRARIPIVGSPEALKLAGLTAAPQRDDSISLIMSRVNSVLDKLNELFPVIKDALGPGNDATRLGRILGSLEKTIAGAETIPGTVDRTAADAIRLIEETLDELKPILANLNGIAGELNDPDGLLYAVMDTDKDVYVNLVKSLSSLAAILDNLDKTIAFVPGQLPQLAGLLTDLRVTMKTAEDVLTALTNNPLLRKGIPERLDSQPGGASPRDISF